MPTIIQLTKAIMKMKTDNARRLVVRTCGLVLMSMATAMSLWLRSPRSYTSFIINYHHNQIEKILMEHEPFPPNGKRNEKFPYF